MAGKRAPRRKVASSHLGAIIVLALGAWVHPALSATGTGALCDQSIDAQPLPDAGNDELAIRVIDHGSTSSVASDDISLDERSDSLVPEFSNRTTGPRIDIMLRPINSEVELQQPRLPELEDGDDLSAPLADKADAREEPTAVLDSNQSDTSVEFPGSSQDDLLRYRQQMFRKDI